MDVAIVGIGCRLPGRVSTPDAFWDLLCGGVDAISEVPPERFDVDAVFDSDPSAPGKIYSRWGGFVDDVDRFDADFFGIAPREAKRMDPQHRILLEVAWEALEDGGQVPARLSGTSTGVFVGISTHDYADLHMAAGQRPLLDAHVNIGNAMCAAPNRLSYLLDLRGPSLAVETACSSSLTALHLARRSLAAGECSMAITAGVNVILAPDLTIGFCKASMISPDGRCRAFDARANGFVRSEGAGAVVLKPLEQALADRDPIYAVVRGSAVNEDGRTTGISLPSADAQEQVLRQAVRDAGVDPAAIQYVEAHGTGTAAGDPVEAAAIGRVYGQGRAPGREVLIGSGKTNVGHLEAGAGITGLIKTALMLRHRQIPPTLHFEQPNPDIPFQELRLRVPTALESWPETTGPAMAGVNATGFGGANAHVILQGPPEPQVVPPESATRAHVLTVSARSAEALQQAAERSRELLRGGEAPALRDLCYTAAVRRTHHEHRMAAVGGTGDELAAALDAFLAGEGSPAVAAGRATRGREPKLAFLFAGMGPQWWAMGRHLLADEPVFRQTLEECDALLRPISRWSLLEELTADEANSRISETSVVQVVNCAFQIALATLWRCWGVVPDAVVGHSAGEMAAAHVAGALTLGDALRVAYHRGRLLQRAAGTGTMLAAGIAAEEAAPLVEAHEGRVSLAAINSPTSITLSGDTGALEDMAAALEQRQTFCRFLPTEVPYHGPQMDAVRDELLEVLADLSPQPSAIPMLSEVTGTWVGDTLLDGGYWWRNIRQPVLFAPCVDALIDDGYDLFLEISPHPALATYVTESLARRDTPGTVVPSLRRHEDEREVMRRALAALHVRGRVVDWSNVAPQGMCVPLPPYPWQRERYWLDPPRTSGMHGGVDSGHPLLGRRLPSACPIWEGDLADARVDYLDGHVVEGTVVFPGAGYVEMALAAARREAAGDAPVTLENVEFRTLLFPGEGRDRAIQLLWHPHTASMEVHSAPRSDEPAWTLHATATLGSGSGRAATPTDVDLAALQARCPEPVAVDAYYALIETYGFRYGGAFRGLQQAWAGDAEALARIAFPPDVALPTEAYEVHPALLDAAFQVLVAAAGRPAGTGGPSGPLFPVTVRRVTFHHSPGARYWVHVTVHHACEAKIEGSVNLIDEDGELAMSCEGLRLDVLDEGRGDATGERIDDWLYELGWENAPLQDREASGDPTAVMGDGAGGPTAPGALVRPATVVARELEAGGGPERTPGVVEYHDKIRPVLDRVAAGYTRLALAELGWDAGRDAQSSADDLIERLGVVPERRRLLATLLGLARPAATGGRVGSAVSGDAEPGTAHHALRRELDTLVARAPAFGAEAALLRTGGEALAGILCGDEDAREVLFGGEALELVTRMYHESPACRTYHMALADAVAAAAEGGPDGRRRRVLEVGAGTGAATATVLPALPPSTEYVVTDISPLFVSHAAQRFGSRPHTRFDVLDIERDPQSQGFAPGSFDMVVAADVLHATADLRVSLGNARRLLAPHGLLVLLELASPGAWLALVFGLLDGWWRYTDTDLRPEGPLLLPQQWCNLLDACGWERPTPLFAEQGGPEALQALVLAHAPAAAGGGEEAVPGRAPVAAVRAQATRAIGATGERGALPTRSWVLLTDGRGVGERLAEALRDHGDTCTLVVPGHTHGRRVDGTIELPPGDAAAIERLLGDLRQHGNAPDALVHLWSLDLPALDSAGADELLDAQQLGCGSVLALAQALERGGGEPPEVWLVTAGCQAVDAHDDVPNVAQAPLWGLGRVLMNEQADTGCRLVDLGPEPAAEEVAALAAELIANEPDEEVALRGSRRYARRFRRAALGSGSIRDEPRPLSPDEKSFRVEIDEPGMLERLTLRETPDAAPGPGQVAIRVRASGLNFRDVLQALGMLPEAALGPEAEAHVPGIECSGVVVECGEEVGEFRPGDEVIALGWGSHGSRVVTRVSLTIPKPPGLTFAQAASISNAFVTAEYALGHMARLASGERVLLHSASGAVGLAAIQYCRRLGAEVFATAGTSDKRAYLRSMGVEHVLDSRSLDFVEEVRERTGGEGVDVVVNSLAGEAMRASLELLRPYGRFVELGKRDVYEDTEIGLLPFRRNLTYTAIDLNQFALDRPDEAKRLLLDAARQVADGTFTPVPHTEFDLGQAEEAFRLMAQARHIGKVVLTVDEPHYWVHPDRDAPLCDADATYLVTGGLGGFGLATAQWLVRQGARNLVLTSRSGMPQDEDALAALGASPARVVVERSDVASEADVSRVLRRIHDDLPPLRGIVHAAMVLDDDLLARLDEQRFRAVLAPKLAGAWNLHRLTAEKSLDFFVLFSSIASVIGHPMQGNYAAANAFLDSLAAHRQARGLPGLAVGWGAIAEVGYVARRSELAQYLTHSGLVGIAPEQALETLEALLRHDRAHVVVSRIDWPSFMEASTTLSGSRRFRSFVPASRGGGGDGPAQGDAAAALTLLERATPEERPELLEQYVVGRVARVLGSAPDRVDPERPLTEMGFDSLMAVELITAIKSDLKLRIPVVKVLEGSSPRELAGIVLDMLPLDGQSAQRDVSGGSEVNSGMAGDGGPASGRAAAGDEATVGPAYPLSFEQQRLWFLHRLDPDNPAYNIVSAAGLSGVLDVPALQDSIDAVVERHEVLRAAFRDADGEPLQVFAPPSPVALPVVDLLDLAAGERDAELQRRATAEARRPFDLEQGPLLRAVLFRLAPQEHVLLLVVHHIAIDAWSMNWLAREIAALYGRFRVGEQPSLPPPAFRYVDYARRERERLDGELVNTQLAYWTRQLADARTELGLPGRALGSQQTPKHGAHQRFELSPELTAALERLSREHGVTLFMTLLAGFQTLLHRHTAQDDICVATPVTTREPDAEAVVGCFMNTLLLRGDLSGDPTFRELLQRTRRMALEAFENQDVPFERVVEAARPARAAGDTPVFQAMLVLHNLRLPELRVAGLELRPVDIESGTAVTDLALLLDTGERLTGVLEYNAERFDAATAQLLVEHFRTLLAGVVADPDRRLSALPLLSDTERHRVLVEWNDTATDLGAPLCLHRLVEVQAEATPHAVAVTCGAATLTYGDLDQRANQLAHRLRRLGVGPELIVGVCMERSADTVVALLAVLKAGAAYLPLDPAHPPARLRFQLADAQVSAVLTQQRLADALPAQPAPFVPIDADWEEIALESTQRPTPVVTVNNLAYVIYTSGSTGQPKGVMVEHGAVCNHLRWRQRAAPLDETDAVLQRTPLVFDPSVWEVFGPLAAGARLVLPEPGTDHDGAALLRLIAEQDVTTVQAVPAVLNALLEQPQIRDCGALRRVFCGGEPLSSEVAERFFARLSAELHHVYGPTEAAIETTHWRCRPGDGSAVVPIGRPIANATVHILDENLQPVPVGVPGELYIGGAGLARGYRNRPGLTQERFVPHPFSDVPGARAYRSGDRGRWRPDGSIEFLGRVDQQVKVRGFRVETGEVEAVLGEHPAVRDVAVVACEHPPGDRRLVAFVVAAEGAASPAELKRSAADRLPDYMVPSALLLRDALPRTASGKVDRTLLTRQALESGESGEAGRTGGHVGPRDAVELQLVQIWKSLLPGRPIGVTDDFFDLGGHSLLAMRAMARIHDAFGTDLPVSGLIQERTIEGLAARLCEPTRPRSPLVTVQRGGDERLFVCVHPVSGTVFCYVELARALGEARPFYALEAVGLRDGEEPHSRIEDMAGAYVRALRELQPRGPYLLGGWSMGGVIAFEMARHLEAEGERVALLAVLDAHPTPPPAGNGDADQVAMLRFAQDLGVPQERLTVSAAEFWQLTADEQLTCVLEQARAANLVPPGMDVPGLRRQLRVFMHNLRAMRDYVPRPYSGRLTLIEAGDSNGAARDHAATWDQLAAGGVARHTVAGDHYTMLRHPNVGLLAEQLRACMAELELVTP
ncbi:MAG TPA: amino acid adenylation domain-containing protein [Egibacteraceae bacterium]|nr:amino acid adenylation domain-containing protein [Egibacteraceae bacterium]